MHTSVRARVHAHTHTVLAEVRADALAERIGAGEFEFGVAALAFSCCPTRDLNGSDGATRAISLRDALEITSSHPSAQARLASSPRSRALATAR